MQKPFTHSYRIRNASIKSIAGITMLFVLSLINANTVFAQDLHYSLYNYSPLNLNPANTGFDNADYRFILNNRSQWKSVTIPYKTFSAGFDMKALTLGSSPGPNTGFGLLVNSDKDGDSRLKTINLASTFSYFKSFSDSAFVFSGGLSVGYTQKSFDLSDLTFDNQFTGDLYDPSAPTGEPVMNDKMSYLDLGFGISAQLFRSDDFEWDLGFAIQHFNKPNNSFYSAGSVKISPHYLFNSGVRFRLTDQMQLLPSVLYMKQNTISELDINAQLKFLLDNQQSLLTNIYLGAGVRTMDAIVLNIGADFKNLFAGFSYDINTSGLKRASNGKGAIEFALIYKVKTVRALPPSPPCIIY